MNRAQRRHQAQRALAKALRVVRHWRISTTSEEHTARRIRDNRTPCSCQMCRNPRRCRANKRNARQTMQERREFQPELLVD